MEVQRTMSSANEGTIVMIGFLAYRDGIISENPPITIIIQTNS
jgi:hypothetical protein